MDTLTDPVFFPFQVAFFFVLGTLFGSFFNVCIYRMPTEQDIKFPASYCYACGTPIKWYDNVPVVSYLMLRGRCRTCLAPFSPRYALIEVLTGFLFMALFLQYGFVWPLVSYLVFTGCLVVSTFTDLDHWIILDRLSLGGAAAGAVLALGLGFLPGAGMEGWIVAQAGPAPGWTWVSAPSRMTWWSPAVNSLIGALAGAGLLWAVGFVGSVVFRKPAMGLGDVKLLMLIGAFCGWQIAILTIFLASVFGSIYGIAAILWDRAASARGKETPPEIAAADAALIDRVKAAPEVEAAGEGFPYSAREKENVAILLAMPRAPRNPGRRHLPFGPHLALAAWILLLFGPPVLRGVRAYLDPIYF